MKEQPLCIRFVNTLNWRLSAHPEEGLKDYVDLISWSRRARVWNGGTARRLISKSADARRKADSVHAQSIRLRETIYRIFVEAGKSRKPRSEDLKVLSLFFQRALSRLRIVPKAGRYRLTWKDSEDEPVGVLWPIVQSAVDLLISPEFSQVRMCPGKGCGWLFVDKSRNGMRKWCDMKDCGNREKARRHYQRVKVRL
jgi:predicted RNA-binding Zn ribbon-like protein